MSLVRSFETNGYNGYVTLGNGNIIIKHKGNIIFKGCIYDDVGNIEPKIKKVIYLAREKATGSKNFKEGLI